MKNDFRSDQESPDQETTRSGKVALLWRVEWIVAIALSAVVLFLLVVRATHAGALWRDEAESAQSARMPIGEMVEISNTHPSRFFSRYSFELTRRCLGR